MADESLRLVTQQRLQQGLSPQQVQFVRMLEMSGAEIEDEVLRTLDDNPALERVDSAPLSADGEGDRAEGETAEQMQLADYRDSDDIPFYTGIHRAPDEADTPFDATVADDAPTLLTSLYDQLSELSLDPREMAVARYVAASLDDNGYLTRSVAELADDMSIATGTDITVDATRRALRLIRTLDPAGVGAADLRDCLLLQLKRQHDHSEAHALATEIIADYFDLFSKKHYDRLRQLLGITDEQLRAALDIILDLNPKPGGAIDGSDSARRILPDFLVDIDGDKLQLTLVNNIPELSIERTFDVADEPDTAADEPEETPADGEQPATAAERQRRRRASAMAFVRRKRDEARDFIRCLQMRQSTMAHVMSAIVDHQRQFFATGDPSTLRPMILKDIAAATGYDLSVISRATQGKYVATPHGIYPLKYFFNERPKADDDTTSQHAIMERIRAIIAAEDPAHPLSDDAITEQLSTLPGPRIARRTVAKYRERLGLPVARLRKKL